MYQNNIYYVKARLNYHVSYDSYHKRHLCGFNTANISYHMPFDNMRFLLVFKPHAGNLRLYFRFDFRMAKNVRFKMRFQKTSNHYNHAGAWCCWFIIYSFGVFQTVFVMKNINKYFALIMMNHEWSFIFKNWYNVLTVLSVLIKNIM